MLYQDPFITAIFAGNDPFLTKKKLHSKQKKIHYSAKICDILIKQKVSESWAWSILTPFLCKLGPKIAILEVLPIFFRTIVTNFINAN